MSWADAWGSRERIPAHERGCARSHVAITDRARRSARRDRAGRLGNSSRRHEYPSGMRRIRWLSVVVPVLAVAIIELVSDGLLDAELPFPLDTIVVVAVVAVLAWIFTGI